MLSTRLAAVKNPVRHCGPLLPPETVFFPHPQSPTESSILVHLITNSTLLTPMAAAMLLARRYGFRHPPVTPLFPRPSSPRVLFMLARLTTNCRPGWHWQDPIEHPGGKRGAKLFLGWSLFRCVDLDQPSRSGHSRNSRIAGHTTRCRNIPLRADRVLSQ